MLSRRSLLVGASAAAFAPSVAWADDAERVNPRSIAVGDVGPRKATFWARGRREGQLVVQVATNPDFRDAKEALGPLATPGTDFTAKLPMEDLPWNEQVFWRATLDAAGDRGEWMVGSFRTAGPGRSVRFAWGGDTCGQGWGINDSFGGMRIFDTIRQQKPDFLIHLGDLIYSDIVIKDRVKLKNGSTWTNLVTPEVAKVSETLAELRGRFRYNHIDENFRQMLTEVPILHMWDDHEVKNNWYPGMPFRDPRYRSDNVAAIVPNARRAFLEYTPVPPTGLFGDQIYRKVSYGPLLDVFLLDTRSYRSPNTISRLKWYGPGAQWLGAAQRDWLKSELAGSTATWKVIANDMPLGIMSKAGGKASDNATNGPGEPVGRELEIADILAHLKAHGTRNVVWLTADLHYATATRYSPETGVFKEFDPFWEFMAGPLNAGTGMLHKLDDTFGPTTEWISIDKETERHAPPSAGLQFYGIVEIDGKSAAMSVKFYNQEGRELHAMSLVPEGA